MFETLRKINERPEVFAEYTAASLWRDEYRSEQMLAFHLNRDLDISSRNADFIDACSAWITTQFKLGPDKSVCDFGCGPGLYTSRFARSGASITGLDFSRRSIHYAKEQAALANQTIDYIQTDYLEFQPRGKFDLITMIMCDYCALSPVQRKVLLGTFHKCLNESGAVLLDVYSMNAFSAREEACFYERNQLNHFWSADEYYCFVNTFKYESHAVMLDKYSIFQMNGKAETVFNWLQYFSPKSLKKELLEGGFVVENVFKDVAGNAFSEHGPEFAVVARKTPETVSGGI